jgi:hypothetical protein
MQPGNAELGTKGVKRANVRIYCVGEYSGNVTHLTMTRMFDE